MRSFQRLIIMDAIIMSNVIKTNWGWEHYIILYIMFDSMVLAES